MDDNQPKVSVLLPVYQGDRYLRTAIESILSQTFTNFELIIIDDASTDQSTEIIGSFHDPRIRFAQNDVNLGLIATLNRAIELARGEYIARMDQDDISLPERLARQVAFMDSRPELAASGTWATDIDEEGKVLGDRRLAVGAQMLYGYWWPTPIIHPSAIIRRSLLGNLRYDSDALHCEDYDLWLRLRQKYALDNLGEHLMLYRVHGESTSIKHREIQLRSVHRALCRNTGLIVSYEDFLELIGVRQKRSPIGRLWLRKRLARALNQPTGRYFADELLRMGDWLGTAFYAVGERVIQSLYKIWLRTKPYHKLTFKGRSGGDT
jgi:glycosyltransferase involved in cell wall biosynthesis